MTPKQPRYAREVRELLAKRDDGQDKEQEKEPQPPTPRVQREVHFIFVRETDEDEAEGEVVDSVPDVSDLDTEPLVPKQAQQPAPTAGSGILPCGIFLTILCLFSIAAQVYQIVNPFTATITVEARSQQIALQGTLQLGRLLNPITMSQSATAPTTGHGHQDAKNATGYLTFYNGQFNQVAVPAGTVYTSASGVQVITDQDAVIPAASLNPPSLGQITVPTHAIIPGTAGNRPAGDIDAQVSSTLYVKNLTAFSHGQDERDFQTVAKGDIDKASPALLATVTQGVNAALEGQVQTSETLVTPSSCKTAITSDHQPGDEASTVKVTVSETCSAIAYDQDTLQSDVTQLLTAQAATKLGSGYGLLEPPEITVRQATPGKQVTLSFKTVSTWVFGIRNDQQHYMKKIIAGKTTQQALKVLHSLPGIESVSLTFSGFGDSSRIPKDRAHIHLILFVA